MSPADIRFELRERTVLAYLIGEIDMSNSDDLAAAIGKAAPNDVLGAVLDLTAVDYLDSAGIHLIFRLRENLRARGQRLCLVIPDDSPVNDALRLAGVRRLVEVSADPDEALRSLGHGAQRVS